MVLKTQTSNLQKKHIQGNLRGEEKERCKKIVVFIIYLHNLKDVKLIFLH